MNVRAWSDPVRVVGGGCPHGGERETVQHLGGEHPPRLSQNLEEESTDTNTQGQAQARSGGCFNSTKIHTARKIESSQDVAPLFQRA